MARARPDGRSEEEGAAVNARLLPLGLALLFVGCEAAIDADGGTGGGTATGGGMATGGGAATGGGSSTGGGSATGGGAATGGGTTDAGTAVDAGTGCAGRTWKLCEDFEGAAAGALPAGWTALAGWGMDTVTVSTDSAHGGTKSLKSTTSNPGQPRIQKALTNFGATAGTHWGRVFYRVESPAPSPNSYWHVTFVGLRATGESRVVDTVQSPMGTLQYLYNLPDDSCCDGSAYNYRFDGQWHCAEWYVNNPTDAYRFFIDGTEVTSIAFTGRTDARLADFTHVALGTIFYVPSNGTLNAWLDDLAIDDARIGCQ